MGSTFDEEVDFLRRLGLIDSDNNLTQEGLVDLDSNEYIIRKHKAKKSIHPNGE